MVEPSASGFSPDVPVPVLSSMPFALSDSARKNVLIVKDDTALAKFIGRELQLHQCHVSITRDAATALLALEHEPCDLMILGLNLVTLEGIELLARVRSVQPRLPILALTARNHSEDRIHALRLGADDCLSKPFSYKELLVRLGSLLRRDETAQALCRISDLTVNKEERRVMRGSRRIDLTPREFAILEYLMNNLGKPVSRATLMREIWKLPLDATTNIVDVYMKYLRDKIDQEGLPKLIQTVRGVGYVLSND